MTMNCMLETQDLAMNGGTPFGALYVMRGERGWEIILALEATLYIRTNA